MKCFAVVVFCLFTTCVICAQLPVINTFSPVSGLVGTSITITGTGFSPTLTGNIVYVGNAKATVTNASTNTLTIIAPSGTTYSPITVTVSGLTAYSARGFVTTFQGDNRKFTPRTFSPDIRLTTGLPGSDPGVIAVADIDADGKTDIIAANSGDSSLAIMHNQSSQGVIAFDPAITVASKSQINNDLAIGDLDGDGKLDIVCVGFNKNVMSIWKNNCSPGIISFPGRLDISTDSTCFGVFIADIDLDGKPDIIVAESYLNKIAVFRNTSVAGSISFAAKVDFATGLKPLDLITRDFDNDMKPDIAVTNSVSNTVSIFRNISLTGSISLAPKIDLTTGIYPSGISAGDFNNDGKEDIGIANYFGSNNSISIYNNTSVPGNLSFNSSKIDYDTDHECIGLADMNGDGKPDIITAGYNGTASVYANTSTANEPTFSSRSQYVVGRNLYQIGLCDLDNDGRADLIFGEDVLSNTITIKRNRINEPDISYINPLMSCAGDTVMLYGVNLTGTSSVMIGGKPASSFTLLDSFTIKAVVPNASFSKDILVTATAGVGGYYNFNYLGPNITAYSPKNAGHGDTIRIYGSGFNSITSVKFGNVNAASFAVLYDGAIDAVIDSAASGKLYVGSACGFFEVDSFQYYRIPLISSFSPSASFNGDTVTIKGAHFIGVNKVLFGGIAAASFNVLNDSMIKAIPGTGASGNITLISFGGTASVSGFIFNGPSIVSFTPQAAAAADTITINGVNFSGTISIYFDTVKASSFVIVNDSTIRAIVGLGGSGKVSVVTSRGAATKNGFTFIGPMAVQLCPPISSTSLTADISGNSYQWQMYTVNGFADLSEGGNYTGTNNNILQISNAPSLWTGNIYRCKAGSQYSKQFKILFANQLYGYGSAANWGNPLYWSCNVLPDANTDVFIVYGNVIVNVNATVRSLTIIPGATVSVNSGVTLTILH